MHNQKIIYAENYWNQRQYIIKMINNKNKIKMKKKKN